MKHILDKKGYYRKETLKEYFNNLKLHQKILLVTTHLIGFAQFLFCVYVYYTNISDTIETQHKYSLDLLQVLQYFLDDIIYFWYLTILPPVAIILDAIFLKLRKFNYLICALNIIIIFFNKLILFLFIHE